ncbi:AraC family transcriptional regulator [Chitinophaga horti]|uniref:AraC family transcriptional regulator n=1 Tax=Chitinophaga horti TaxID=2920382 RepID=A0ABY6J631_9BACT|nr:AraC family transcriptional regulator [Chitinophaga horti]UYQ95067.1 AraC family transcriptional regulator [Chitinophaga horti]
MKTMINIPVHQLNDIQFLASEHSVTFGEHEPNHRIDFYALVWFKEDAGSHFIDFETYPIQKDTVYLIGKHQVHSIPSKDRPDARVIVFTEDFYHLIEEPYLRLLFLPFNNVGIVIPDEMVEPMAALFRLIVLEYEGGGEPALLLKYMTALLMHLYRFSKQSPGGVAMYDERVEKLFRLLDENYKEERSVSFYADKIGITPKRLNEIVREKFGFTVSQIIYHLLLIEAKREIGHGRKSIKEIAYELGFSEQSYFSRFFKKQTGTTPENFRQQALMPVS